MTSRRGFFGIVAGIVAATPFIGSLKKDLPVTGVEPIPARQVLDLDEAWSAQGIVREPRKPDAPADADTLMEVFRLHRDGVIDTPTLRRQVTTMYPVLSSAAKDGRRQVNSFPLSELTDVGISAVVLKEAVMDGRLHRMNTEQTRAWIERVRADHERGEA